MVKAVIGEESKLKSIEDRLGQSGLSSQVGLVIGKLSSTLQRGFVFDLVPTPSNDDGEPPCRVVESVSDTRKKGSKPKSQAESSYLSIDKDWVSEHARQVSRMLVGGLKVVGIYIWAKESSYKNSTIILCQTVRGVADASSLTEMDWDERLLFHISYSPLRWTCRNCSLASNISSSSLYPCDFKMGRVLSSLQKFRCLYHFDIRFPVYRENGSGPRRFAEILRHVISSHAIELKAAKALINGKFLNESENIPDGLQEVELLLPFVQNPSLEVYSEKEVVGVLVFCGSVCSLAYLNSKEPVSQALADIKGDIITSLQSRLDILCDEADREIDLYADGGGETVNEVPAEKPIPLLELQLLRKQCSLSFPRRVFVPWLADTYICDYIHPSETLEVLKDHCVELMSMESPNISMVLEPEAESTVSSVIPSPSLFLDKTIGFPLESKRTPSKTIPSEIKTVRETKSTRLADRYNVVAAFFVIVLAVLVGLLSFVFSSG